MFHPQRPVIVERRDALSWRNEIRPALLCDPGNELNDRSFARTVVPRWEWVGLSPRLEWANDDSAARCCN
jgi:hypothetical protein